MRSSQLAKLTAVLFALSLSACAAIQAQRAAQEEKKQAFVQHIDIAHIWVTPGDAPAGKPYHELGDLKYTEPFSPDAIDSAKQNDRLKQMANTKYPDSVDAIIHVKSDTSSDGSQVIVTAQAIQYEQSADRDAMHKMNEGLVASPNN